MDKNFDSFTFGPWWSAQCRWTLVDTEEYWREVRMPGADLSDLPQEVQDEVAAKWTPELVAQYEAWLADPGQPVDIPGPRSPTPKQQRLVDEAKAMKEEPPSPAGLPSGTPKGV